MDIRKARASDIEAATELVEHDRRQRQKHQSLFWRRAAKSATATREFLGKLLTEPDTFFLVARKFPAPPVYDPGGDTYLIDDFCVLEPRHWLTVGEALLSHASTLIHEHGGVQIVIICADRDLAKAEMLRRSDLTIASNWWTKPLK